MNKVAAGMITGGLIGAVGLSIIMNDKSTRKRLMKDSQKMTRKALNMIDNY